jgi:hypothetical protein
LLAAFNKKPRVSPELALKMLQSRPEYAFGIFVEFVVTTTRAKGYFGRFMKHRNENGVDLNGDVSEAACGDPLTSNETYRVVSVMKHVKKSNCWRPKSYVGASKWPTRPPCCEWNVVS